MIKTMISLKGRFRSSGKKPEAFPQAPLSARGLEIAKSREELMGLLNDLPESEYELSFSDLVEKGPATGDQVSEEKKASPCTEEASNKSSTVKERKKINSWMRSRSAGEGVLLNMYMPSSLTRSRTAPAGSTQSSAGRISTDGNKKAAVRPRTTTDSNKLKRDWETPVAGCCWSMLVCNLG